MVFTPKVNTLPVELLSSILILWSREDGDAPWMAASVCQVWRRIVLACPMAWSSISLILKASYESTPEDRAWCVEEEDAEAALSPRNKPRPLDLWFARSGKAELSLAILVEQTYPHIEARLADCVRLLEDCRVSRLRFLRVQVESLLLASALFTVLPGMDLHTFELIISEARLPRGWRGTHIEAEGYVVWGMWKSVRRARHIKIEGCMPRPERTEATLTLQVRDARTSPNWLITVLDDYKNLTTLELSNISDSPSHERPSSYVTLAALQQLTMQRNYMDSLAYTLAGLRTPALTHLTVGNLGMSELTWIMDTKSVESSYEATADYGKALAEFVATCPSLKMLRVTRSGIHDRHLVDVLRNTPSLHELQVEECLVGAPLLRALTLPLPQPGSDKLLFCPDLQRLSFHKCDLLPGEHLAALVQSRNHAHSEAQPITHVRVLRCPKVSVAHFHKLLRAITHIPFQYNHRG